MAARAKLVIEVTKSRNSMTVSYRTTGSIAGLVTNDVRNTVADTALLPTTGSKVFWEAALSKVDTDITAGNGGGT